VHKYDGNFPERYFKETLDYLDMKLDYFFELCDKFSSPHLWKKEGKEWKLRHKVS